MNPLYIILIVVASIILLGLVVVLFNFFGLWFQALLSNAKVGLPDLIGMRFRKVDARTVVLSRIRAVKSGLPISTNQLETHYLAGGRVVNVVTALIAAMRAKIDLEWDTACSIDLAGRDIFEAVNTSVNPKVIDCPNPAQGRSTIDAVAKDGIQLKARARVTVRTNLARLIGGATEETIIARVGEGIVSAIGGILRVRAICHRHRRHRRGREHRRQTAGRPGGGGQAPVPGRGREAPRDGRRPRAGE